MTNPVTKCTRKSDETRDRRLCLDADNCWVARCGYSRLLDPNPYWRDQNGICRYQHCIETMPIRTPREELYSCPLFGHDCPGGQEAVYACREQRRRTEAYGPTAKRIH